MIPARIGQPDLKNAAISEEIPFTIQSLTYLYPTAYSVHTHGNTHP
jgi:hypothetical protein